MLAQAMLLPALVPVLVTGCANDQIIPIYLPTLLPPSHQLSWPASLPSSSPSVSFRTHFDAVQSGNMSSGRPGAKEQLDGFLAGEHPAKPWDQYSQSLRDASRLGMLPSVRLMLASTASFAVGAALGISHGSTMAGLKFRAEHAHKLPTTPTGWFMYHKSKNYIMARDGLREGVKMGFKISVVTSAMFLIEDLYDEYRQSKDFLNTTLASLTVAGGFSLWSRSITSRPGPGLRLTIVPDWQTGSASL